MSGIGESAREWDPKLPEESEGVPAAIERVGPEIEVDSPLDPCDGPAARMTGPLEHDDPAARPRDQRGRHQASQATADDDQVRPHIAIVRGLHESLLLLEDEGSYARETDGAIDL